MMTDIINIKNKKDLITLDLRCKQMRYLKNIKEHGQILFYSLSNDDVSGYNYLFDYGDDLKDFYETLKEDILDNFGIRIKNKLEVLK